MSKLHRGNITRAILLKHLVEGICKITFIKKDGSFRNAYCTLHGDLVPSNFEKSIEKIFLPDARQEILPFWDMVEGKWKSFYVDKVELFITADELKKDLPPNLLKKEEEAEGDTLQLVDKNQQKMMDAQSEKQMKSIDHQRKEKDVDPVNRKKVARVNRPVNTRSNITNLKEKQKENLDKARTVINRLRSEAEKRRK
jgi:hypothetical protein